MVRLRVLGGAVLERDGTPVAGRAAQRHHLALLAYLAASPSRSAAREKLVAYLWPESDTAAARHRLSVALHVIRKELGEGSITAHGDALALTPEEVEADVAEFVELLAAGRLEEAVGLYRGSFLDGFFLSGAREFDGWMEGERERLARLYAEALERLASEAEGRGDPAAAVAWWRRLASHDPLSSRVALGLMEAMARSGDIPGALSHARAHATLVQAELEVPPDPEVVELAGRLGAEARAQTGGRATPATRSPSERDAEPPASGTEDPAGPGRPLWPTPRRTPVPLVGLVGVVLAVGGVWTLTRMAEGETATAAASRVVVLPFEGELGEDNGDARMGEVLARRIHETLAHIPGAEVAPEVGRPPEGGPSRRVYTPRDALRLDGYLDRLGNRVQVTVRLRDPGEGEPRWVGTFEAAVSPERGGTPGGGDRGLVEELSLAVSDAVRLEIAPFQPNVYTENSRAWDRFLQGVYVHRRWNREDLWRALNFYREAWEEDPDFALAHAIAGNAYLALVEKGLAPEIGFEEARVQILRALELDPFLAEGHAALGYLQIWWDRDFDAGEESLRKAIMIYPTLPQARGWYGYFLLYVRHRPDAGVAQVRKALEVDPLNTARSHSLERALYLARRYDEVSAQNRHTRSLDPALARTFPDSPLADALREMGRYEEAAAELLAVAEREEGAVGAALGATWARMGREAEARAVLADLVRMAAAGETSPHQPARLLANLGDRDGAFRWLERAWEARSPGLLSIGADPLFDPIRDDPRFGDLCHRLELPCG